MNLSDRNVLFLHGRLAGYFDTCIKHFAQKTGAHVHVVKKSADKLAPFQLEENAQVKFYNREEFSYEALQELSQKLNPAAITIAGWTDKDYLKIVKPLKKEGNIPLIGMMDNQWESSVRQKVGTMASPMVVKPYFTHLWVPGMYQYEFARKLGFERDQILTELYCADLSKFSIERSTGNPIRKRFLFVGRLVEVKGIDLLLKAIDELNANLTHDWEFWIIGRGPLQDKLAENKAIKYIDFIQPEELAEISKEGCVFVLPSTYEPWAVVVHEFGLASCPLIVSDAVGARSALVRSGYNGYVFPSGDHHSLYQAMRRIIETEETELFEMGTRSHTLAQCINQDLWTHTLANLI